MKEYTKYCAPLLHLSGASVTLLTTDDKNNAISLANKVPENADALIIAGGDGTISEVRDFLNSIFQSCTYVKISVFIFR